MSMKLSKHLNHLREDSERWRSYIASAKGMMATYYRGMMATACDHLDAVICTAVDEVWTMLEEDSKKRIEELVIQGKPKSRLTMGQNAQILVMLKADYKTCLRDRKEALGVEGRLFTKRTENLIQRMCRKRNDFAHGRFPSLAATRSDPEEYMREANEATSEFLNDALELADDVFFCVLAGHEPK